MGGVTLGEVEGYRTEPVRYERRVVVGVDLGQAADRTAISALEKETIGTEKWEWKARNRWCQKGETSYRLRALRRLPLGTSYPDQVAYIAHLLGGLPIERERVELVIDQSGVGRPVFDMFVDAGLGPIGVSITSGEGEKRVGSREWRVSKLHLVSRLEAMLHCGDLKVAADIGEGEALRGELRDFRRHVTAAGHATFSARTGRHDDLVLAVSLATWWATRPVVERRMIKLTGW